MDARETKGLQLAATRRFRKKGDLWIVPSQAGNGSYVVDPTDGAGAGSCSCPDFETNGAKCKHIFAVVYTIKRETETAPDGSVVVTETVTATAVKKTTYSQNWPAYNKAQTNEKAQFMVWLHDLCKCVPEPQQTFGRHRLPLRAERPDLQRGIQGLFHRVRASVHQ